MLKDRSGNRTGTGIALAVLAAALYALSAPLSKKMLDYMPERLMAGFLYVGAGAGMLVISLGRRLTRRESRETGLTVRDWPFTVGMILLDIAAPICLLMGLKTTSAASVSLLNNFEIVATALIALMFFKEKISGRLWLGIAFVTAACAVLSLEDGLTIRFSVGAVWVLAAGACWGLENNCTRRLSNCDPLSIVLLKGIFSGGGSILIGLCMGEKIGPLWSVAAVMAVGLVAYGLSTFVYIYAQRMLGAARTSAYYAIAPFIGMALSLAVFRERPQGTFWLGLILMSAGAYLASSDEPLPGLNRRKRDC